MIFVLYGFRICTFLYSIRLPGRFRNVLEEDGENRLDRSCEKLRSVRKTQGGEEYHTYSKKEEG